MDKIVVEYDELMELITNGLLKHDKDKILGMALIKGSINTSNQAEWDDMVSAFVNGMAFNVLINLKDKFKENLMIIEDGSEF